MTRSRAFRSSVLAVAVAVATAALAAAASGAADAPSVDTVLQESRVALGLDALPRVPTVHLHGTATLVGIKGTADVWEDTRSGQFATYVDAGPVSGAQGYDGSHAWNRDASGLVWNDDGVAARYTNVDASYQTRYLLWSNDHAGATVVSSGVKTRGDRRFDVLRVTPPGGVAYDLWIDASSHLPARTVSTIGNVTSVSTFSDYRSVDGLKIPFVQNNNSNGNQLDFTATTAVVDEPAATTALRRPTTNLDDASLPSGTTTIPFDLVDNHVSLPVVINGKGPFHFIFDTGGSNFLDSGIAQQLGLVAGGSASGSGVGAKTEAIRFATVDTLGVGEATLRKQRFIVAPVRTGFGVSSGKPVDGLIGFEVLARFVTTFDYGKNEVVLRTSASAGAPSGTTIPFILDGTHPEIACSIASFSGRCTIDTGSRLALSVLSPFLAAHPSIAPSNATAVGANGFGIGGPALGRLARTTLQVGNFTIPDTITDLSAQTKGAFADPFIAGNIGAGTWKRFALTLDYDRQVITLVPNANFGARESYDRSGTFLITQGGKIVVADVRPGTPAADAGIARGDVLTAIAGKDASTLDLAAVRELFRGAPGTAIPVTVAPKNGEPKTVTMTLRDYV